MRSNFTFNPEMVSLAVRSWLVARSRERSTYVVRRKSCEKRVRYVAATTSRAIVRTRVETLPLFAMADCSLDHLRFRVAS
mgnify:CR=1 FL=1